MAKFLSIPSTDSKSTIKITLWKKFHVSPTILKFSSPNLAGPYIYRTLQRWLRDGIFWDPASLSREKRIEGFICGLGEKSPYSRKTIPERSRAQNLESTKIANPGVSDFGISISGISAKSPRFSADSFKKIFVLESDFSRQMRYTKKLSLIKCERYRLCW